MTLKRAGPDTEQSEEERLPQRHRAGPTRGSEKWKKEKTKKKGKEKDDERERESPKLYLLRPESGFEMFALGVLLFCIFRSFVNPTVRLLQENFNHKARRHARNGSPSLTVSFPIALFKCRVTGRTAAVLVSVQPAGGQRLKTTANLRHVASRRQKRTEHCD